MSSTINNILCCAGNCFCTVCCTQLFGLSSKINYRIGYILITLFAFAYALILNNFLNDIILVPFKHFTNCDQITNTEIKICLELSSSYRISFSLACLHLLALFFSIFGEGCRKFLQAELWFFKFLLVIGIYFGTLFVSNSVFYYYALIGKYLSFLFLIYQVLVTISFAHIINLRLVNKLDNNPQNWKYKFYILFLTFIFIAISGSFIFYSLFDYFSIFNLIIVLVNLVLGTLFILVSISNFVTKKRLLTSIYILSYTSYLSWSAIISEDDNYIKQNLRTKLTDSIFGLIYLTLSLCFVGFFVKKQKQDNNFISSDTKYTEEENLILENNPIIPEATNGK